jgi:hypothetical protein
MHALNETGVDWSMPTAIGHTNRIRYMAAMPANFRLQTKVLQLIPSRRKWHLFSIAPSRKFTVSLASEKRGLEVPGCGISKSSILGGFNLQ